MADISYDDESNEGLLLEDSSGAWKEDSFQRHQFRNTRTIIIPWALTVFFFSTTCFFAWQSRATTSMVVEQVSAAACQCHNNNNNGTYETGFSTDFVSAAPEINISIIQKQFTNDLHFNTTSQQLYNAPLSPTEITYIGAPGPAIDAAWTALLHDQYVALSPAEAQQFPERDRELIFYNHEEHHYFELSVFHNLHCLNELRMRIDREYYDAAAAAGDDGGDDHHGDILASSRVHLDHCVDQIRQALQCHADLTPVPMRLVEGYGAVIGNGEMHTCRDFDAIREWVHERGLKVKALGD